MYIHIYTYAHLVKERIIMQNWLMLLLRLRSPSVCLLQAGDPGKLIVEFSLNSTT